MAAIAGVVYPRILPGSKATQNALALLQSRCPDEPQLYSHKNVEIGARGIPLAFNERYTLAAAVDAQLTNAKELQQELKDAGCQIEMPTVSELILHAYDVWGLDFVDHLHGAFAIALFDVRKRELILVRDRLGIKPLYWSFVNNFFAFGSELKSLLSTGLLPQSLASEAVAAYLFLGYFPQDITPIEGANKLLPGSILRFSGEGSLSIRSYWRLDSFLAVKNSPKNLEEELRARLQICQGSYEVTGDLPSALLGGLFKGERYAIAAEYAAQNDDAIAATAALAGDAQFRTATILPGTLLDELVRVVWHLDEPIAHPATIGTWRTCQLAKQLGTSLCSSLGAEEVLLGPPEESLTRSEVPAKERWLRYLFPIIRTVHPRGAFHLLRRASFDPWLADYAAKHALFPHEMLRAISPPLSRYFDPDIFLQRVYQQSDLGAGRNAHLYLEAKTILTDEDVLQYERLATASGVPWSAPFLDHRLVELVAGLCEEGRQQIGANDFALLRRIAGLRSDAQFTPSYRKSKHFLNPWLYDGAMRRAFEYLLDGSLVESGWVSRRWIEQAINQKLQPPATFQQLWAILVLEVWVRLFINRPLTSSTPDISLIELIR